MSYAAEAELVAININKREVIYNHKILEELGHPQLQTPIITINSTAKWIFNNKIQPN